MSHSCIVSGAKSALEASEAAVASAENALAAAKLANRHMKKILGAATLAEDLEAVVVGDMGEEGAGMMRDLMLRQGSFTSIRERSSPDLSTSLSSVYYSCIDEDSDHDSFEEDDDYDVVVESVATCPSPEFDNHVIEEESLCQDDQKGSFVFDENRNVDVENVYNNLSLEEKVADNFSHIKQKQQDSKNKNGFTHQGPGSYADICRGTVPVSQTPSEAEAVASAPRVGWCPRCGRRYSECEDGRMLVRGGQTVVRGQEMVQKRNAFLFKFPAFNLFCPFNTLLVQTPFLNTLLRKLFLAALVGLFTSEECPGPS